MVSGKARDSRVGPAGKCSEPRRNGAAPDAGFLLSDPLPAGTRNRRRHGAEDTACFSTIRVFQWAAGGPPARTALSRLCRGWLPPIWARRGPHVQALRVTPATPDSPSSAEPGREITQICAVSPESGHLPPGAARRSEPSASSGNSLRAVRAELRRGGNGPAETAEARVVARGPSGRLFIPGPSRWPAIPQPTCPVRPKTRPFGSRPRLSVNHIVGERGYGGMLKRPADWRRAGRNSPSALDARVPRQGETVAGQRTGNRSQ